MQTTEAEQLLHQTKAWTEQRFELDVRAFVEQLADWLARPLTA